MHHAPPMLPRPRALVRSLVPALVLLVLASAGCTDTAKPRLLPLDHQSVAVNETLKIDLRVENPDGLSLTYSVDDPGLPSFFEVTELAGSPAGAVFRWTPLASHVGTHELTFRIDSSAGATSTSVIVEVIASASAAPIFLRPGFGGTFDLSRNPTITFDVEVRDDDTLAVEIRPRDALPEGASLRPLDDKRAHFEWSPTPEQISRSLRWNIALEADDGAHVPPTPHDYLIVLRTATKGDCPGQPPVATVVKPSDGATIASAAGYTITVSVTDDFGVRDAPILYYTMTQPDDPTDLDSFDGQIEFGPGEAADQYRAIIPPISLADGQQQAIWYIVSVTDNDDAAGTACDHTVDTSLRSFVAIGGGSDLVANCDPCSASSQCLSGVCAAERAGRCLPRCVGGCTQGSCTSVATVDGQTVEACSDFGAVCQGTSATCQNDGYEPNDTKAQATFMPGAAADAIMCNDDLDYYRIDATGDGALTVRIDGFDAASSDLDLYLVAEAGTVLDTSAGSAGSEQVAYCLSAGERAYAVVAGYDITAAAPYHITASTVAGACCADDPAEPDDDFDQAKPVTATGDFDGAICPNNSDLVSFTATGAQQVEIVVVYTGTDVDLDLMLYDQSYSLLAQAWTDDASQESLTYELPASGTYYVRVAPYGSGEAEYVGSVTLTSLAGCTATLDCPVYNVCNSGACVGDYCDTVADCPSAHRCEPGGPNVAWKVCIASCALNTDCRSAEACKWLASGRSCGIKGSAQNGGACMLFEDCGGQRDCVGWPGGYCARVGCQSSADCESNTFCATRDGKNVCVRRCGGTEPACRLAEGYTCTALTTVGGANDQGCVP